MTSFKSWFLKWSVWFSRACSDVRWQTTPLAEVYRRFNPACVENTQANLSHCFGISMLEEKPYLWIAFWRHGKSGVCQCHREPSCTLNNFSEKIWGAKMFFLSVFFWKVALFLLSLKSDICMATWTMWRTKVHTMLASLSTCDTHAKNTWHNTINVYCLHRR